MTARTEDATDRWPLVDREAPLAEIDALAARGRGVLLTGLPGTGRTRLLREALHRSGRSAAVADHETLPTLPEPSAPAAGPPPLLAVDDAHRLPPAPAQRLAALVRQGRILLLATALRGAPLPAPIAELRREELLGSVATTPFDLAGTTRALRARLGSQVATDTAARLWELTGGNPLLLAELVEASIADGTLRPAQGLWQWQRSPTGRRPAGRVRQAVERLSGPLDAAERELIALLALGGPLSEELPLIAELAEAADRLLRRGVVAAEPAVRGRRLRLSRPLSGHVILTELPPRQACALRVRLADALDQAGGARQEKAAVLLSVALRVDAGQTPSAARLRTAAEVALRRCDFAAAERFARLALDDAPNAAPGADAASALLLGRALSGQGRGTEAEAALAAADRHSGDVLAARVRNLAWTMRRVEAAAALAERVPDRSGRLLRATVGLLRDRMGDVAGSGETAPREASGSWAARSCAPIAAFARVETEGSAAASALLERCRQVENRTEHDRIMYAAVGAYIAVEAGDDPGLRHHLDRLRRTAAPYDQRVRVWGEAVEARAHRAGCRLPEAVALLRRAAAAPEGQDWFTTRPWLLAQLAGALAESGQHTEAVRTLIEVRVAVRRTPRYPLAEDHIALEEARVLGRSGDVPGALRRAEEVARRSAAAGRKATALAALHLLARLGRAAAAAELLDALGVAVRCPVGELRALHVRALAARDAAHLDDLADRFARLGRFPLAAECASQAHRLSRDAGRHRAARASLAACRGHLAATVGTELPGWAVSSGPSAPARRLPLTAREHQTASLAASGLDNLEIARRLSVSVRTVENHLYRAYGKLGITSRAELGGHVEARTGLAQPLAG
ncbi:LuxR C-terminal-related transcriptional regulator [Streptomyces caelestis]|uniref:DNA-binding CsgD family transcriptional regulator n=1 Tax=Streptomyces caelestis TaxID=36816 RepID=A0A7W9HC46_9ACTN|nr:helix-turn-helix transcriptional regulator [Streptomyces caelestis]MBB5799246.1 DNA-binding CsgD family transcriptional regulator [Streptomyces caelestis]GGW46265.1 hypothetical protein GCM10010320_28120 [Streptomyces caelestis]